MLQSLVLALFRQPVSHSTPIRCAMVPGADRIHDTVRQHVLGVLMHWSVNRSVMAPGRAFMIIARSHDCRA
jgi:hypothetical protein